MSVDKPSVKYAVGYGEPATQLPDNTRIIFNLPSGSIEAGITEKGTLTLRTWSRGKLVIVPYFANSIDVDIVKREHAN